MHLITPEFGLIFWQTVILFVVLGILGKFAWRPILNVIQEREVKIEAALAAAEEARKMVKQVQADKEALLQAAYAEREKIIEEAIAAKQVIIEETKTEAAKTSQQIIAQAHTRWQQEKEAAIALLQEQVAMLAVQIAEQLLRSELKHTSTQEELVQRLIKATNWSEKND
jgi:F-type H+-transporting ATPase subunit b